MHLSQCILQIESDKIRMNKAPPPTHRLYAMPHSLYSARARSYLIKQGISFEEYSTGHESFKREVLPEAKLPTIPTLVTPEGEVVRDGAAIIEYFEFQAGRPCQPQGACQSVVSALIDVIGSQGLLRPAMHYRWNFPEENAEFVRYHFLHSQRCVPEREEKTDHMMDRMRHAAVVFGVTDETRDLVETLYLAFLDALNSHFEHYPYLLGGRPCIGDFGLLAPLYAHLGRDPYPARLMQQRAPRVWRWVERMNRADQDAPEYLQAGDDFLANDVVPNTLIALLRVAATDFMPETRASAEFINHWLAEHAPEVGAPAVGRLAEAPGSVSFSVGGQQITALAQPYRHFQLQRVQQLISALSDSEQRDVCLVLERCRFEQLPSLLLHREIVRGGNLERWGVEKGEFAEGRER
jgi:glutathione S-transferase